MLLKTVYLALGSNLGDREQNLERAIRLLGQEPIEVVRRSSIYETAPMILENQPWFLNQVIEVKTGLLPRHLLHSAQRIELELGRVRMIANGPRTIDIDVLLYGRTIMASKELTIPHPRMAERRFVLEPLVEIAPNLKHPVLKQKMSELLSAAKRQDVRVFRREGTRGL